ncbi:uncharacterized protein KQ657_004898 [Scheffersomyces spartinae]|uniref:Uncharacterized protein n=1 Tax=Scheffersomyces spartinae TaxID=45513 RepID=A0A9P8AIA6_9ASCO|nr:uncharacterized protein KQ657_004898 [Scheffersomyces spartinae]KAG7194188.1 hypothetical protein KQ657_004898 [Scheffersomyces spartinae]
MESAINAYISSYDKIAQQYVSVRHEILALYNEINKRAAEDNAVDASTRLRIAELEVEFERVAAVYERHVGHLNQVIAAQNKTGGSGMILEEVGQFHQNIELEERELRQEIQYIQSIKGTVLEDMRELVKDVDMSMRRAGAATAVAAGNSNAKPQVSVEARTFSRDELKELVDDIKLDVGDSDMVISLDRYLDEQLENGRAFKKCDGSSDMFEYDARSSVMRESDVSVSGVEYDAKINQMVRTLSTLISENARAKESWAENARLMEVVNSAIESKTE